MGFSATIFLRAATVFTTGRHPDRGSLVDRHFAEPALGTEAQFCSINFQLFVFSVPRISTDRFGFIADRLDLIRGSSLRKGLAGGLGATNEYQLTLRQADQLRTDIANVESGLEMIMAQLARMPTRKELSRAALMGMLGGACLVQTLAFLFL